MRLEPRFAVDAMLGRLARWLRVLGFDTVCDASLPGIEQLRRAQEQGRILLTRNRWLMREMQPRMAFEVQGDDSLEQLRQVVTAMALRAPTGLFTRCMLDNSRAVCAAAVGTGRGVGARRRARHPGAGPAMPGVRAPVLARFARPAHASGDRSHFTRLASIMATCTRLFP
jgi:hypothetical protein